MPEIYSEWDDGELEAKVEEVFYNVAKLTELFHEEARRCSFAGDYIVQKNNESVRMKMCCLTGQCAMGQPIRKEVGNGYVLIAADSVIMMDGNEAASNGLGRRP